MEEDRSHSSLNSPVLFYQLTDMHPLGARVRDVVVVAAKFAIPTHCGRAPVERLLPKQSHAERNRPTSLTLSAILLTLRRLVTVAAPLSDCDIYVVVVVSWLTLDG